MAQKKNFFLILKMGYHQKKSKPKVYIHILFIF